MILSEKKVINVLLLICVLNFPSLYANVIERRYKKSILQAKKNVCELYEIKPIKGEADMVIDQYCRCDDHSYGLDCENLFENPCDGKKFYFPVPDMIGPRYFIKCAPLKRPILFKCPAFLEWNQVLLTCAHGKSVKGEKKVPQSSLQPGLQSEQNVYYQNELDLQRPEFNQNLAQPQEQRPNMDINNLSQQQNLQVPQILPDQLQEQGPNPNMNDFFLQKPNVNPNINVPQQQNLQRPGFNQNLAQQEKGPNMIPNRDGLDYPSLIPNINQQKIQSEENMINQNELNLQRPEFNNNFAQTQDHRPNMNFNNNLPQQQEFNQNFPQQNLLRPQYNPHLPQPPNHQVHQLRPDSNQFSKEQIMQQPEFNQNSAQLQEQNPNIKYDYRNSVQEEQKPIMISINDVPQQPNLRPQLRPDLNQFSNAQNMNQPEILSEQNMNNQNELNLQKPEFNNNFAQTQDQIPEYNHKLPQKPDQRPNMNLNNNAPQQQNLQRTEYNQNLPQQPNLQVPQPRPDSNQFPKEHNMQQPEFNQNPAQLQEQNPNMKYDYQNSVQVEQKPIMISINNVPQQPNHQVPQLRPDSNQFSQNTYQQETRPEQNINIQNSVPQLRPDSNQFSKEQKMQQPEFNQNSAQLHEKNPNMKYDYRNSVQEEQKPIMISINDVPQQPNLQPQLRLDSNQFSKEQNLQQPEFNQNSAQLQEQYPKMKYENNVHQVPGSNQFSQNTYQQETRPEQNVNIQNSGPQLRPDSNQFSNVQKQNLQRPELNNNLQHETRPNLNLNKNLPQPNINVPLVPQLRQDSNKYTQQQNLQRPEFNQNSAQLQEQNPNMNYENNVPQLRPDLNNQNLQQQRPENHQTSGNKMLNEDNSSSYSKEDFQKIKNDINQFTGSSSYHKIQNILQTTGKKVHPLYEYLHEKLNGLQLPQSQSQISVQQNKELNNVLPVNTSDKQSFILQMTQCALKNVNVPVVFNIEMPRPLTDVITTNELNDILSSLREQSKKGIKILLNFPSER